MASTASTRTGHQATVSLDNGQQIHARLVIGADGAHSRVRTLAGIGVHRDQYHQQALVISVRYQGPVADITWQGFHPSGPRAFLPLHSAGRAIPAKAGPPWSGTTHRSSWPACNGWTTHRCWRRSSVRFPETCRP